jgi:hypothetical protein
MFTLLLKLFTGTPFPNGDRSMYGIHQILGIRLKLHISNDIFAVNKALPKTHPFEKVKGSEIEQLFLSMTPVCLNVMLGR